jgi:hypothetical protein
MAKVRDVISSNLLIPDPLTQGATTTYRRVILVGHGVANETRCLEELGLPLDAFPTCTVVGTVDSCIFATRVTKQHLSLEQLIDVVGIPLYRSFGRAVRLHCAGNDANYTLRALLALLEIKTRDSDSALLEVLGRTAREDIPAAAPDLDRRSESSSNDSDEGLAGTSFDEHCDV